ncbi:MAG: hypothetical protein ACI9JY_000777, partial [Saprospiraceae bacterium]
LSVAQPAMRNSQPVTRYATNHLLLGSFLRLVLGLFSEGNLLSTE